MGPSGSCARDSCGPSSILSSTVVAMQGFYGVRVHGIGLARPLSLSIPSAGPGAEFWAQGGKDLVSRQTTMSLSLSLVGVWVGGSIRILGFETGRFAHLQESEGCVGICCVICALEGSAGGLCVCGTSAVGCSSVAGRHGGCVWDGWGRNISKSDEVKCVCRSLGSYEHEARGRGKVTHKKEKKRYSLSRCPTTRHPRPQGWPQLLDYLP